MSTTTVHFAHANGIPKAAYGPLFDALKIERVIGKQMLAHDDRFPPNNQWSNIVDEIIDYLDEHSSEPVIGIGHSLGSICTFLAAQKRPDLFSRVIMLDPPVLYGPLAYLVKFMKVIKKTDSFTPAGKSKNRKRHWPSAEVAKDYFASKRLYNGFHPESFNGYVSSALTPSKNGVELAYKVENEVALFRSTPDNLNRLAKPSKVPCHIFYGDKSDASHAKLLEPFARDFDIDLQRIAGEHMFPLQSPLETAKLINHLL